MKKNARKTGLKVAAFLFTLGIVSCGVKTGNEQNEAAGENSVENCVSDTLVTKVFEVNNIHPYGGDDEFLAVYEVGVKASIEVPSFDENPVLAQSVMEWIMEKTGSRYEGELQDVDAMLKQLQQDQEKEESTEFSICKIYETPQLVTFLYNGYTTNVGAAHGLPFTEGATFRKSDGKIFGSNMLSHQSSDAIQPLLKKGLKDCFEVASDQELEDCLMLDNGASVNYLPMPENDPWVDDEGLVFSYQAYEIACYAAGMPSVTIPLKDAAALLTPTAKKLLDIQ